MNTNRIQVFHIADGNGSILGIPHDLVFDFLITLDAFLHKYLMDRGEDQRILHDFPEFFLVVRKTTACTAKGKGGTKNNRITDFRC